MEFSEAVMVGGTHPTWGEAVIVQQQRQAHALHEHRRNTREDLKRYRVWVRETGGHVDREVRVWRAKSATLSSDLLTRFCGPHR